MTRKCAHGTGNKANIAAYFKDSICCIELATGRAARQFNKRKHIDIKYNYIMSMLEEDVVKLVPVRSEKMEADSLTKPLAPMKLKRTLDAVSIFNS